MLEVSHPRMAFLTEGERSPPGVARTRRAPLLALGEQPCSSTVTSPEVAACLWLAALQGGVLAWCEHPLLAEGE